jgi:predicted small integral membrane protein
MTTNRDTFAVSPNTFYIIYIIIYLAGMGEKRNVYRLLVGKPEGKRPLGRPRRRWIDNIKIGLLEIALNVVDWIGLAQDRYRWRALLNSVMNLRVP